MGAKVHIDSSVAIGVASRRGAGKLRHVRIGSLWIQELVETKEIEVKKVPGDRNVAYLLTKRVSPQRLVEHMDSLGYEFRGGKADMALEVQGQTKASRAA